MDDAEWAKTSLSERFFEASMREYVYPDPRHDDHVRETARMWLMLRFDATSDEFDLVVTLVTDTYLAPNPIPYADLENMFTVAKAALRSREDTPA